GVVGAERRAAEVAVPHAVGVLLELCRAAVHAALRRECRIAPVVDGIRMRTRLGRATRRLRLAGLIRRGLVRRGRVLVGRHEGRLSARESYQPSQCGISTNTTMKMPAPPKVINPTMPWVRV